MKIVIVFSFCIFVLAININAQTFYGNGSDGSIIVSSALNINTNPIASGRTVADAVNFNATCIVDTGTISIALNTTPIGLAIGDEVLIINLRGISTNYNNVGNCETRLITNINGNSIILNSPLCKHYGNTNTQKIMVQRVPNYVNVTINTGASLTTNAWNGSKGGVFFIKATGTVTVDGSIIMTGKGYAGGAMGANQGVNSSQQLGCSGNGYDACGGRGESFFSANGGIGGGATYVVQNCGGIGSNSGGGGGGAGYALTGNAGTAATYYNSCSHGGNGGAVYGTSTLVQIFLGAGGGGGAGTSSSTTSGFAGTGGVGGAGGGIIIINTPTLTVSGSIQNNGKNGDAGVQGTTDPNNSGGSGGAGAGGSIIINASNLTVDTNHITTLGGIGGTVPVTTGSGIGGNGSVGRIRLNYNTLSGITNPLSYNTTLDTNIVLCNNNYNYNNPTIISANPATVSYGQTSTLTVTSGTLSPGSDWHWYSNSCGSNYLGTGLSIIQIPTVTTTYFLRMEGPCNTTSCESTTVILHCSSVSNLNVVISSCTGSFYTVTANGGGLGTNANWYWYSGTCGGVFEGTGNIININTTIITTYYVRAEGTCNTTACISITTVYSLSIDPDSITASSQYIFCSGTLATLTVNGGSLGTVANWKWYTNSCGGTLIGSGLSLIQVLSTTKTYWVRAEACNFSNCISKTIIVNITSMSANSISISNNSLCNGQFDTLKVQGGLLGTGANWYWYSGSCPTLSNGNWINGTLIGTGSNLIVLPSTTVYYLRAEGICNTTLCISVKGTISVVPNSIIASTDTICYPGFSILSLSGGILGANSKWTWYSSSCGGIHEGTGTQLYIYPIINTIYYIRAEGQCNTSTCLSINITVISTYITNIPPFSIAAPDTIYSGSSSTLSVTGGTGGVKWVWFSTSCGGYQIGTGLTIIKSPTLTTTYFVRAEVLCNTTTCSTAIITVISYCSSNGFINSSPNIICPSSSATITLTNNGVLGVNANWYWYSGSCGGILIGTGMVITQNPTTITTYYSRAEGTCNTTLCKSVIVSTCAPTTTISSTSAYPGDTITLHVTATNAVSIAGFGLQINYNSAVLSYINPNPNLSSGNFHNTNSALFSTGGDITIVQSGYLQPPGIKKVMVYWTTNLGSSTPSTVNNTAQLFDLTFRYYSGSTSITLNNSIGGGQYCEWTDGSGIPYNDNPSSYFYINGTVTGLTPPQPSQIGGFTYPIIGDTVVYKVANKPGVVYTWSAPSGWIGYSTTNSITFIIGSNSGAVTVTPSNTNGFGAYRFKSVTPINGFRIKGNITYDNNASTPLDSVSLFLKQNGIVLDTAITDINGAYQFNVANSGTYNIYGTSHKAWGGVNITDVVKMKRHYSGAELLHSSLRLHAGDVNQSNIINVTGAVKVARRYAGADTSFTRGDWVFEKPTGGDTVNVSTNMNDTIIVNGADVWQNFKGICVGDVNGSYNSIPIGNKSAIVPNNNNILNFMKRIRVIQNSEKIKVKK